MSAYEIVYILTNILYLFAVNKMLNFMFDKEECKEKSKKIIFIFYYVVLSGLIFITRVPIVIFAINIVFLSFLTLCFKSSVQRKIMSVVLIYSVGLVIELISLAIFGFFEFSGFEDSTFNSITILIFLRVVTLVVVHLITRYKKSLKNSYKISKIYYLTFSIVLFGTLYLFIAQLESQNLTVSKLVISGAILIIVNVTMIIIDDKIYNSIVTENEKNMLKQQNIAYENQMEIINQSTEEIRLLKHDFKNHLLMLSNIYKSDKKEEFELYIDKILGNIENDTISNSNNFVIDSILNFKLRSIKDSDININLDINVPISVDIYAYDLTSILSNLLDNAVTACEKSKDKKLNIKIISKMGNLIILIDNSYDGKIICENGKLKTTKLFKSEHGLGIKSVEKTLEKYGGELRFDYTSNVFSTSVLIPYM